MDTNGKPEELVKLIMNPVRLRIVQFLMAHQQGTVTQMKEELSDIPPASLYRHMKILCDHSCIDVVGEKKIRGTVEKTYALNPSPAGEFSKTYAEQMIQTMLLSLMSSFRRYFANEHADPIKDMLALSTSVCVLSDEELKEMMNRIGEAIMPYVEAKPADGRKTRRMTLVFSPCEEE